MLKKKVKEAALDKLHIQWSDSLETSLGQLQHIDAITRQLQKSIPDRSIQQNMVALRNKILMEKNVVSAIAEEVSMFRKMFSHHSKQNLITADDMIENDRLRERVYKVEHYVTMLRYDVNQLLSGAI